MVLGLVVLSVLDQSHRALGPALDMHVPTVPGPNSSASREDLSPIPDYQAMREEFGQTGEPSQSPFYYGNRREVSSLYHSIRSAFGL
jgi:hypothetical protein